MLLSLYFQSPTTTGTNSPGPQVGPRTSSHSSRHISSTFACKLSRSRSSSLARKRSGFLRSNLTSSQKSSRRLVTRSLYVNPVSCSTSSKIPVHFSHFISNPLSTSCFEPNIQPAAATTRRKSSHDLSNRTIQHHENVKNLTKASSRNIRNKKIRHINRLLRNSAVKNNECITADEDFFFKESQSEDSSAEEEEEKRHEEQTRSSFLQQSPSGLDTVLKLEESQPIQELNSIFLTQLNFMEN